MRPIMKQGIRILRPKEYDALLEGVKKTMQRKNTKYLYLQIFNALLYTGMRYVELQRFARHREWFDRETKSIYLPKEASRKKKRTMPDRYVYLSSQGVVHIDYFVMSVNELPPRSMANEVIKRGAERVGLETEGLSVKSFRKTWESWLVVSYPKMIPIILMSQGHTEGVSLKHYLNLPFTDEVKEIRIRTAGWSGERVI